MDEMVGPRNDGNNDDQDFGNSDSASKKNGRFIRTTSRHDEFLSTCRTVWMRVDDEEVSEDKFLKLFNELTSNSFAEQELEWHIQSLCDEGKLMKSDGMLYKID